MKTPLLLFLLLMAHFVPEAQNADTSRINQAQSGDRLLAPLKYLASDQLRGRHIGLPEIDTAASYIAAQFRQAGIKTVAGATDYYQLLPYHFSILSREAQMMDHQVKSDIPWNSPNGVTLKNVMGYVQGTDPVLRNQYILLSAHYDHVGVAPSAEMKEGKRDSIFNGARDNATGTAAVIDAARYFVRYPPRRSILFICYSAEEEGGIGSKLYASHPLVPLDHIVYNLNIDNAGYDTTGAVCLFGLGRTDKDALIQKACKGYGMAVLPEPEGQGLFERSDNYSLAQKGIPAPNFSLGMTDWDGDVWVHYHDVTDEVDNMDLDYVVKFIRAYILSAQYIANDPKQPRWTAGDPYEEYWKALFTPAATRSSSP